LHFHFLQHDTGPIAPQSPSSSKATELAHLLQLRQI
jgi:hypothetical protein